MADYKATIANTDAAISSAVLSRQVRAALLEVRRGLIEELKADSIEDQARALRRRARLRQVRALEKLTGVAPFDPKQPNDGEGRVAPTSDSE